MKNNYKILSMVAAFVLSACSSSEEEDVINSPAAFSGQLTAEIQEDTTDVLTGTVNIADADEGEAAIVAQSDVTGEYGQFSIASSGEWRYQLDGDSLSVQGLHPDEQLTESFTIESVDGSTSNISITIAGEDDVPTVSGSLESTLEFVVDGSISGKLVVAGGDAGEANFVSQDGLVTTYGAFSIDDSGQWQYRVLINTADTELIDEVPVAIADGSSVTLSITITPPTLTGTPSPLDSVPDINCTTTVNSISALEDTASYEMTPGETLCLAAGNYTGLDLKYGGQGTADLPITIAAAEPGKVVIGGEVQVTMSGEYVVLQGFIFKDGSVDNTVIQTRGNNSVPCNHCRITENSLINMDGNDESSKWVYIYGSNNRIDHNWFAGKTSRGALFAVDRYLPDDMDLADAEIDRAQIDHNYFGDRPPVDGKAYASSSDNEYEAIRIGTSDSHQGDSFTVVEFNYFERIQGEAEVISNKSGNNTIRYNTVRNSNGSIVTRHGDNAIIHNNFIFGDDHPFSGGIRLVDGGHTVTNNYIEGARYLSSNWNGGIVLTSGNNSSSNGYQDVENVLVAHNTIVDSVNSLNVFGGKESNKPSEVYFVNNVIADAIGPVIKNAKDWPTQSVFAENFVYGQSFSDDDSLSSLDGMLFVDTLLAKDDAGLYRPSQYSPDLATDPQVDTGDFSLPTTDMDGQPRLAGSWAGADVNSDEAVMYQPLTPDQVGPKHYRPPTIEPFVKEVTIVNHDFDSGDLSGWQNAGAAVTTDTNLVFSRGVSVKLDSVDDVIQQTVAVSPNSNYTFSAFVKGEGELVAEVGGQTYTGSRSSSSYGFTTVSFPSGDATEVLLKARLTPMVANKAPLQNSHFDNKNYDHWTLVEGSGIGQVQDSSNSSDSTDGSVKFKYDESKGDNGTPHDPYIAQTVSVLPNTQYTLTMYTLLKSSHNDSTVLFGAVAGSDINEIANDNPTYLASKVSDYDALKSAGAKEADDGFLEDTLTVQTGSNDTIAVFAQFQSTSGDEIRVDAFELSYMGPPADGATAYFDSFRLVSHASLND